MEEISEQTKQRLTKLQKIKAKGENPYPNDFFPSVTAQKLHSQYDAHTRETLENNKETFSMAGRVLGVRAFGKAAFLQLQDRTGKIQAYVAQDLLGEEAFKAFMELMDIGDIVGICGSPFKTKTNELTLKTTSARVLSKCLHPLPEKWHGLQDIETRYRQRYLDLIVNPKVKEVFQVRSKLIQEIRNFFIARDYLEVETPMMHPIAGGALAKPFVTHHNTLDMDLYLRIAPELYLKRLVVGGLERVFEINRNFRNEGISIQHNPEFTMIEFYEAYATYDRLMNLTEELIVHLAKSVLGKEEITYQGETIYLKKPWARYTLKESVLKFTDFKEKDLDDPKKIISYLEKERVNLPLNQELGYLQTALFEAAVEKKLIQPTFIYQYPLAVSPLSRKNDQDSQYVDRFELYIYGREMANAFSELNDPMDQKERFLKQMEGKASGDEESHEMDEDYVRALEYGMPPTAGEGIGIDRLVMLFTDSPSIRDVILFPQLKKV